MNVILSCFNLAPLLAQRRSDEFIVLCLKGFDIITRLNHKHKGQLRITGFQRIETANILNRLYS